MVARSREIWGGLWSTTAYTINAVKFNLNSFFFFYYWVPAASISNTRPEIVHRGVENPSCLEVLHFFTCLFIFLLVNVPPATSLFLSTGSVNKSRPSLLNKWAFKLQQTGLACMGDCQSPRPLASSKETNTSGRGCAPLSLMSVLGEWPDLTPMCFQAAVRVI